MLRNLSLISALWFSNIRFNLNIISWCTRNLLVYDLIANLMLLT